MDLVKDECKLERAKSPEAAGVSSKSVIALLDEFKKRHLELHSLIIVRHGKVAFECYCPPYNPDTPHAMHSFSKSVTSIAAGFAITEGLFSLDSKIHEYFPEYKLNKKALKYADKLTIRHILTMTSGKSVNVAGNKATIDWTKDFLNSPFVNEPGEHFHYTNENGYMISALIRKLTGLTLREYLKPRLFEPLGIDVPIWETDKNGQEAGGWGLYLKSEDGAKFMQCCLNDGKFNGRQVIPEWWIKEATTLQTENRKNLKRDSNVGYGYQFWMCRTPNTYAARGMFCQQGIVFKDYDACFFYTASDSDEQKPMDIIYTYFPEAFKDGLQSDAESSAILKEKISALTVDNIPVSAKSPLEAKLQNSVLRFKKQPFLRAVGMPTSLLPLTVTYMMTAKFGDIDYLTFDFKDGEIEMKWSEEGRFNQIPLGTDGTYRYGVIKLASFDMTAVSYAYWESDNILKIVIRPLETASARILSLEFKNKSVKIIQGSTPNAQGIMENIILLAKAFIGNSFLYYFAKKILRIAPKVLEPKIKAKIKTK
ncbi:MAG: beta-lactamase family protein [Clostridiales bacterium]|nr:beta-lactamase family protein [Clostridiales bacterium]